MNWKNVLGLFCSLFFFSCVNGPERNCSQYKNGEFIFKTELNGELQESTFNRYGELEIDNYNGKIDSSSVKWINDCEYILKSLNPKSMAERKPLHFKILSTTDSSYTFEYGILNAENRLIGTAIKLK